jgi:uncharacterized membrane protein YjfL (UPF0719 family)
MMLETMWRWDLLLWHLTQLVIYTSIGLAFFALAYFVIDKFTPFSFRKELIDNKNTALAIFLGAVFIAIALILAASIRG